MKTLFIFRHAKTEAQSSTGRDFDRNLTGAGKLAAQEVGKALAQSASRPEALLISTANRTRQTAKLVLAALGPGSLVEYLDDLYTADLAAIESLLAGRHEGSLAVIGHNPSMEELYSHCTGHFIHIRPGTCIRLNLDIDDWASLGGPPRLLGEEFFLPTYPD